jgi:hypothetical protein
MEEDGVTLAIITLSTRPVMFIVGELSPGSEHTYLGTMLDLSEYAYLDESCSLTLSFDLSKS